MVYDPEIKPAIQDLEMRVSRLEERFERRDDPDATCILRIDNLEIEPELVKEGADKGGLYSVFKIDLRTDTFNRFRADLAKQKTLTCSYSEDGNVVLNGTLEEVWQDFHQPTKWWAKVTQSRT